nr:uncharacterized protein CTRU02_00781 [Colletotrichum truncatum]KAF6802032.1 hypothetical protein CTRU02_00781 [Colletotrichum truncatum]
MVHPSHQPQYSVSVENDVGLGEWLDKLNSNPRLREESAFLKDGVVHLLLNLVEICESGVDLDLLKEDITTISSYNTKRAPRPNEDDSTAAASGLQRSRSRDASTELPAKRRRRLPDSIMKKGKEDSGCLQPSQEEESTGSRGYSTTPASGAELTSFRPTVRQPLEDEHGMSGLSSGEEDTTLARRKVTRRREAARRIPKTLDGLQERLAGGGKLDTARKSSYLDAMFRLREELSNRTDVVFQEEDYYSIGDLLFHRIFGNDVESRLYYLIREYDAAGAYRLNRAICRVDKLAEKLQHSGVDELASFVRSWGEVTHTVSSAGTSEGRLHGYWRQYDLWKRWHELKELGQVTSPKRL